MESLAALLPEDGPKPKRFGEKENDEVIWATGAFVHGGVVGVLNNTKKYPKATKVFLNYLKQQCPGFRCNSIAVFKGTGMYTMWASMLWYRFQSLRDVTLS